MELLESCVTFSEFYVNYFTDVELTLNSYIYKGRLLLPVCRKWPG